MLANSSIGTGGQLLALIAGGFVGNCGVGNCGGENPGHGIERQLFEGVRDREDAGHITGGVRNTPDSHQHTLQYVLLIS